MERNEMQLVLLAYDCLMLIWGGVVTTWAFKQHFFQMYQAILWSIVHTEAVELQRVQYFSTNQVTGVD